jgi:hypothetical protein
MFPASRAASAQTEIGKSLVKRMSRSIPHAEGQDNRTEFLERETAELWIAEIGEAEEGIAVRVELGRKPGIAGSKNQP